MGIASGCGTASASLCAWTILDRALSRRSTASGLMAHPVGRRTVVAESRPEQPLPEYRGVRWPKPGPGPVVQAALDGEPGRP
jgi:hypothetical protein